MLNALTEVEAQLLDTAREFADKILIPNADRYDRLEEYPQDNVDKLAELGLLGLVRPVSGRMRNARGPMRRKTASRSVDAVMIGAAK